MKEGISRKDIQDLIMDSSPEDYTHDDYDGLYVYDLDINLRFVLPKESEEFNGPFEEAWTLKFPDKENTTRQLVIIYYGVTPVYKVYCVWVDGYRHLIPVPRVQDLTLGQFEYKVGLILNHTLPFMRFDQALDLAGIKVRDGS